MSDFNTQVIEEFRANAGKVGGNFEGARAEGTTQLIPAVALNRVG